MPEDCLIGFEFKTEDDLVIMDDTAQRDAADRLAGDIAYFDTVAKLATAYQTPTLRAEIQTDPDWEDGVPPDLADGNDFLL